MTKYILKTTIGLILFPIAAIYDICSLPSTAYYDNDVFHRTKKVNYLISKNFKKLRYTQ